MKKFNLNNFDIELDTPKNEYKICTKCNTENLLEAKFCIECGNRTFKDGNSVSRYCKDCEIKLDDNDDVCPICGGANFVGSINDLIQNKLKYSHAFLDTNKELKAKLNSRNEIISNYEKEIKRLEKCKEAYTDEYLKIKSDVEKLRKRNNTKIEQLTQLIEEAKNDSSLAYRAREKELEECKLLETEYANKEKLLVDVEEEYESLKRDKEKALDELLELKNECKNKTEQVKLLNKSFSLEFHEFEASVYSALAHYYYDSDAKKCFKYAVKGYEVDEECLAFIITIINDSNNLFEAEEIKKWNDLAFKFYNHDPDKLEGVHHTAYTTLLSSKESRHYNGEKCLKNIHGRKSSTFISIYYYCLCYERLNRYEELKNEIGRVLNSINKNIYFECDREYYRKIFEPIIKRMEKREKYGD